MRAQRIFLWAVAVFVVLLLAGAIVWRLAGQRLIEMAMVPSVSFAQSELAPAPDYRKPASWVSRPGLEDDPSLWVPEHFKPARHPQAATFFVPPTAYLDRARWNAPLDDAATNKRLRRMVEGQGSVFNGVSQLWVPRYRQATFGAFLQPGPEAEQALDLAYGDVVRAFEAFLAATPADAPLILGGHSQGALHLRRLLREYGSEQGSEQGTKQVRAALAGRLVAVYLVGWPVTDEDLAQIRLPACASREQAGCVASWQSVAADSEIEEHLETLARAEDIAGKKMLCVNPLTGDRDGKADAKSNLGMLKDRGLKPREVGAACGPEGLLRIAPAPADIGPYILPNGNFHVYDIALFWANLRADAEARLSAYEWAHQQTEGDVDLEDTDLEEEVAQ